MNLVFNEFSRQPFEIVNIMATPEAAIWRCFAEYMFWRATLSFVIFLEEVFILNLNFQVSDVFISIIVILVIYLVSWNFKVGWKRGK